MMRVAILLTCYNRRYQTLNCLEALFKLIDGRYGVFLVDDGSSDGTDVAVTSSFPNVNLIIGDGNLFWNRGMNLAWQEAGKGNFDYYIWLNDDVVLYENSLKELLECSSEVQNGAIISGIIENKNKSEILYGGSDGKKRLVKPNGTMQPIKYLNGNVVLVPKAVYEVLGNLDPFFHHDLGDVDYGLRAWALGIPVYSTKTAIAHGEKNSICRERLNGSGFLKRFKRLYSPLGSNPNINFYFRKRHKSLLNAILYYFFQHFLNLIPDSLNKRLFGNKYQ